MSASTKPASNRSKSSSSFSAKSKEEDYDAEDLENGNTRLMAAIEEEDADLAIELLDTEPAESLFLDAINYYNMNALQLACKYGLADVAMRLIDAGVDVNYLGGRGFRAIDFAIQTREDARKIVADADSQIKLAAEDEQWSLVCEWQADKIKHQSIVREMDRLIPELEKHAPDASAIIGEDKLREQFNKQIARYVRNGQSSRVQWNPTNGNTMASLIFLHIMRTYKESQCYVTDNSEFGIYTVLDFERDRFYLHDKYRIEDNKNDKSNKRFMKNLADQVAQCIQRGVKQVILPVVLGETTADYRHANMLIFRTQEWTVEHYEPHGHMNSIQIDTEKEGIAKNKKMHSLLERVYSQFVDELNKRLKRTAAHKKRGDIQLRMSSDVCPSHFGFQAAQNHDEEFEGIGLCAMWSLFVAEMSAAYPTLTLRQVQGAIYHKMSEYDMKMAGDFLLNLMKGYATQVLESTRLYCSFFDLEPAEWSFSALNRMKDASYRISWLVWFESNTSVEPGFVEHRIHLFKQFDPDVDEEEAHYAEKYLRLKRRLACLEDSHKMDIVLDVLPPAPEKKKRPKKTMKKTGSVGSKGGRKTRRWCK